MGGGRRRAGLAFDWSDVGVITNVQPDHLGLGGVETIDDLVSVKALVAERVREGGTLVLNADDARSAGMAERPRVQRLPKRVVYYAARADNPLIREHLQRGGTAYFPRNGWLVEAAGGEERRVVEISVIPITLGGVAAFHTSNVAAAAAACRASGLSVEQVAMGLMTFRNSRHNAGRTNLFRVRNGHVMVDFGHNPHAFAAMAELATRWPARVTAIVSVPGDRPDWLIEEAGRVAARGFDRVIVRQDADPRGRAPEEVAALICNAVGREAPERDCRAIADQCAALEAAVAEMQEGEPIILFYDELPPVLDLLQRLGAAPVERPDWATPPRRTARALRGAVGAGVRR